jgi:hypothetical protein
MHRGAPGHGRRPWTFDHVRAGPPGTSRVKEGAARSGGRGTRRKVRPLNLKENSAALPMSEMPDTMTLVRELNHRVKNNLQIIVSLMNLQKRMMPPERREDIRFIEEHVQSMSVAYRLVYATGSMIEVSLTELVTEVLSGLRQIAGLGEEHLQLDAGYTGALIGLDHAIALSLYLAVLMPPYLDRAIATNGEVTVTLAVAANLLTLSVRGTWITPVRLELLRGRLMQAYAAQLQAEIRPASTQGADQIRFMLENASGLPVSS